MHPKTEEFLYFLLWTCDRLGRPTFRNLTDSFECWAYRNGFHRRLAELERRKLVEALSHSRPATALKACDRVVRLTESGRLHALGGRDPEAAWAREWDGQWRLALFDLPAAEGTRRNRLRNFLRAHGFGWLQNSVWIRPHPLDDQERALAQGERTVESLLFLEARPGAGETDEEIVAGAWDFQGINSLYARYQQIAEACPSKPVRDEEGAELLRQWAAKERAAWLKAIAFDPLLPERLLPKGYLGQRSWELRQHTLEFMAKQVRSCRFRLLPKNRAYAR